MKTGEANSFGGERIEAWRLNLATVATEIGIAEIISDDE